MPRHAVRRFAVLATIVLAAGCGGDEPEPTGQTSASPPPVQSTTAPSSPAAAEQGPIPGFGPAESVASDISVPWGVTFLPDGAALVAERTTGRILRVTADGQQSEEMTVPDVADLGEGGLLGLAASPSYADDGLLYAYYTTDDDNRIVRFTLGGEPEILLEGIENGETHNGGRLAFGPDGMLYAGTGDAGDTDNAQDEDSLNGKILRLTPEGEVPEDNPAPNSYVYSLGHRNVQGLAWDDDGTLYGVEFGSNEFDEVNAIEPGGNYGWPEVEGVGGTDEGFLDPLVTWPTNESSPSGAAVAGATLYVAALRGELLWAIPITAPGRLGDPVPLLDGVYGRLRTVALAPDGALWVTSSNTSRGDPLEGDDHVYRFPPT